MIAPTGRISVAAGSTQSFEIKAQPGYMITDVLVDGQSMGRVSSYTFKAVDANHAITVKIKRA